MASTADTDQQKILFWPLDFSFVQKNNLITSYEVPKIMDYVMQTDKSQRAEISMDKKTSNRPTRKSYAKEIILQA